MQQKHFENLSPLSAQIRANTLYVDDLSYPYAVTPQFVTERDVHIMSCVMHEFSFFRLAFNAFQKARHVHCFVYFSK